MSSWTHIRGTIQVCVPGRTQAEIQYILDTVLEHLPVVTGSERDMFVHAVKHVMKNSSSSHDEFGMKTNNLKDEYGKHIRKYGMMHATDKYHLVLEADLRDRTFEQTRKEFLKWLIRLAKRLMVDDVLVRLWEDYGQEMLLNERHWDKFNRLNESPSWMEESDGKPCWWEYLLWERHPYNDMPLSHVYKYFDDKGTNEEILRRRKWEEDISE